MTTAFPSWELGEEMRLFLERPLTGDPEAWPYQFRDGKFGTHLVLLAMPVPWQTSLINHRILLTEPAMRSGQSLLIDQTWHACMHSFIHPFI